MKYKDVAELDVFQVVSRNAGDDRCLVGNAIRDDNIADIHATQLTDRSSLWTSHATAQAQKKRAIPGGLKSRAPRARSSSSKIELSWSI